MAEKEAAMEEALIRQLTQDVSQWVYRPDIHTEEELWANFRAKLDANNMAVLDGAKLTDVEFGRVQQFVLDQAQTPYRAALWLAGENGEAVIPLEREDASLGSVHLMAVSSREIAGARSSYEVINQFIANKSDAEDRKRRFDVTLLINGIPMIQIELKNQDHPYMDAFRQIKKYSIEDKYCGLFGMVQMYVVTNGSDTRYIAAAQGEKLNETFLTPWVNAKNEPVEHYLDFAREVLRIPMAHQMVGQYAVLDAERRKVILLRPYQVHAIEAVKAASAQGQSGFVWHTTGSGKTLTSYTVAKNLLLIPGIDKTIFLIDRRDLDQQTSLSFKAYAENDIIDVDDTANAGELVKKLYSNDRIVIVTTIQKMEIVRKRYTNEAKKDSPKAKKLRSLRLAFVVDECHRTVTPETQRDLKKFFAKSLWYGFTGTPIFEENKRARKGDLARTTEGLFGPCLHNYTIKEALANHAVLGFQIEYKDSLSHDQIFDIGAQLHVGTTDELASKDFIVAEEKVLGAYYKVKSEDIYDTDEHRLGVINYIVNKAAGKFRLQAASKGDAYEAILTVPSIPTAQKYYRLIKDFVKEGHVSDKIKAKAVDFPRVAITYTVTENDEGSIESQQAMKESLRDYNAMFGTNFHIDDLSAYNANLNDRLARKKGQYKLRKEQLDLVIVVDRLLTGFDAPPCALLFVDRPPMAPQNLIQAFSRTNRIYDKSKRFGMIVIFQRAAEYRKAVDDALLLYSNGGTSDVSAPPFAVIEKAFKEALAELRKIAAEPQKVDTLGDIELKKKFAKAFQKVDKLRGEIQVYDEFEEKDLSDYGISENELNDYTGKYQNVLEELRHKTETEDIDVDVEYELETVTSVTIDYRYIVALIQKYVPDDDVLVAPPVEDQRIDEHIEALSRTNPQLAGVIGNFWSDMKAQPAKYRGQDAMTVIETQIESIIKTRIEDFAREWSTKVNDIIAILHTYHDGDTVTMSMDYDDYKKNHEGISKLKYKRRAKEAVVDLIKKIRPLREK
ncbi:MAG: HsdR family type I site-specific deoxyribonuclease [Mitsuokella sp.]|uniref:type I restriction endonuclease subunit R, EcoR124 family n=1 Tax=Mitsuokella sp. TaxID=2049034 RepID=UPI003F08C4C1